MIRFLRHGRGATPRRRNHSIEVHRTATPSGNTADQGVHRSTVARSIETERGSWALLTRDTGTSRDIWVPGSRYRRMARRRPPGERFRAVANSRNSSPVDFVPRTKNGIEIGRRSHTRRSPSVAVKVTTSTPVVIHRHMDSQTLDVAKLLRDMDIPRKLAKSTGPSQEKKLQQIAVQ